MIGYSASPEINIILEQFADAIKEIQQKILAFIFKIYLEQTKCSPAFLNVRDNYPDAPLTLVILNDVRRQFKHMTEDILKGKDVLYLMEIKLHKDKPEIVISNPNQIQESIKVDGNRSTYEVVRRHVCTREVFAQKVGP